VTGLRAFSCNRAGGESIPCPKASWWVYRCFDDMRAPHRGLAAADPARPMERLLGYTARTVSIDFGLQSRFVEVRIIQYLRKAPNTWTEFGRHRHCPKSPGAWSRAAFGRDQRAERRNGSLRGSNPVPLQSAIASMEQGFRQQQATEYWGHADDRRVQRWARRDVRPGPYQGRTVLMRAVWVGHHGKIPQHFEGGSYSGRRAARTGRRTLSRR